MEQDLRDIGARDDAALLRAAWRTRERDMGRWETSFRGLMTTALDRRVNLDDAIRQGERAWKTTPDAQQVAPDANSGAGDVEKGAISDAIRGLVDRVAGWLRSRVAEEQFITGAQATYLGLALDTGEDAGQYALDQLGINRTFAWASQRDFVRDRFAVRGSKIIQHAYGEHLDQLARIVIEATDPAHPLGHDAVRQQIEERWAELTRAEAVRIARTEVANVWERTNWYTLRANGVRRVKWIVASGPAIGRRVGRVCEECLKRRGSYVMDDLLEIPPVHPHCRCTLVADLDPTWLPPLNPWTGSESPLPARGLAGNSGRVPRDVPVMKARALSYPPGPAVDVQGAPEVQASSDAGTLLRDRVAELREEAPDVPDDQVREGWHEALDQIEQLELPGPQDTSLQKAMGKGWDAGLHPRGWHGHWAGKGGSAGGRSEPKGGPPKLPFKPPPAPRGKPGERKAGGFGANGMTATRMGDLAEASIRQLGIHSLLIGRRQGPLDAAWDHTYGFEVKSVSVHAREYKAAMKTHEIQEKRDAAEQAGLRGAMMIVVMDTEAGKGYAYWREGIQNGRLNEDWNFAGEISVDTGQRELEAA